jgi:AraC-like DNA-binding protein
MYEQRLMDDLSLWERTNRYNSPANQARLLKEGGYNPALMYGRGGSPAGGASPLRSPDVNQPQFRETDMSYVSGAAMNFMNGIYDLKIKDAQHKNMLADNDLKFEDLLLKRIDKIAKRIGVAEAELRYEIEKELGMEHREEVIKGLRTDRADKIAQQIERGQMHEMSMREAMLRILREDALQKSGLERKRMEAQIRNLEADTELKVMDRMLSKFGLSARNPIVKNLITLMVSRGL